VTTGRFSHILVPVDFSPCSEEAFRAACSLARLFQADLTVLHVIDTKSLQALNLNGLARPSEEAAQLKRLRHEARLKARRIAQMEAAKGIPIRRIIAEGGPFAEIARVARREQVDLVVMGSYGGQMGNVEKIFFGSTAEKVVRTAGCPVLTVPLATRLGGPPRSAAAEPVSAPKIKEGRRWEDHLREETKMRARPHWRKHPWGARQSSVYW
jgi:nucleotide-binding universal stress UspA family protein